MKKAVLLVLSNMILTSLIFCQITVNSGDFPSIGDTYTWATDIEPTGITPGSPGPNQTWDFTGSVEDETSPILFVSPSATPFAAHYPMANIATNADDTIYSYMLKNSNKASYHGTAIVAPEGDPLIFHIYPEELFANYPINYLDTWQEEFYSEYYIATGTPGADSMRFKSATEKDVVVDAWGTVIIPLGTFNALRIKEVEMSYDSTWFKIAGIWMLQFTSTHTFYNYEWITNQQPVAPFVANMSSMDDFATIEDVTWVKDVVADVEEQVLQIPLNIYPNPASDFISVTIGEKVKAQKIRIMNYAGQLIEEIETDNNRNIRIDITNYSQGIYQCVLLNTNSKVSTGSFIVNR